MTRDRFDNILKCRRFIDYCASTNEMLNSLRGSDPFWAVPGFCDELSTPFGLLWNPGQLLDIDEQTVPWKGRHRCRVYNPKKPEKRHLKAYCLNDSSKCIKGELKFDLRAFLPLPTHPMCYWSQKSTITWGTSRHR